MEEKQCKNCAHYYQHYAMDERRIFRVFCGHCTAMDRARKNRRMGRAVRSMSLRRRMNKSLPQRSI